MRRIPAEKMWKRTNLRYYVDNINLLFSDVNEPVTTINQIVHGTITPDSLGSISIFKFQGRFFVYKGNR